MDIHKCDPSEIALKSFFLGPQAENSEILYEEISLVLDHWIQWRKNYAPEDGNAISAQDQESTDFQIKIEQMRSNTLSLLDLFSKEIPKFSPRYLGHMFSEISMPALIGHIIALLHNPNNISHESSRIGVDIETSSIRFLAEMMGYPSSSVGHFTSGGTIANFEAIYRAKNRIIKNLLLSDSSKDFNTAAYSQTPHSFFSPLSDIELFLYCKKKYQTQTSGFTILAPESKHYSWKKASSIFGFGPHGVTPVELNAQGQLSTKDLDKKIQHCLKEKKLITCIVSILGTTELGTIDPIDEIVSLLENYKKNEGYHFWHHTDAAYGAFFATMKNNTILQDSQKNAIKAVSQTNSITIDPHKLGYVPYAAGTFLCQTETDYYINKTDAPYVDFSQKKDPGPYTLEGSRPATGAVAMYLTAQCIGLNENGYGKILERTLQVTKKFISTCNTKKAPLLFINTLGTNIICFGLGTKNTKLSLINQQTQKFLKKATSQITENHKFYFSKTILENNYERLISSFCNQHLLEKDCDNLILVRMTLMNPFIDTIHTRAKYISECLDYIQEINSTTDTNKSTITL